MEKYIFLDFDGVINTQNDKFDKNAMANLRRLLEKLMLRSSFLPHGDCKAWSTYSNCGRNTICKTKS